ncbi:MAG TPA: NADH-quinone oxidoreductase subunit A [Actinomycetota bacterium]|nr:NADH-quinone oxidoreductase subunit A [Actinomycetota bacterium]
MLASYLPIVFMLVLAGAFAVLSVMAARFLSPKDPTPAKLMPYECGITEVDAPAERFPVRFYLTAMLFVIFDVEVILMFPWAVVFKKFGMFALVEMSIFIGILLVAYFYVVRNGALEWD